MEVCSFEHKQSQWYCTEKLGHVFNHKNRLFPQGFGEKPGECSVRSAQYVFEVAVPLWSDLSGTKAL